MDFLTHVIVFWQNLNCIFVVLKNTVWLLIADKTSSGEVVLLSVLISYVKNSVASIRSDSQFYIFI